MLLMLNSLARHFFCLIATLFCMGGFAVDSLVLHGFASQGIVYTSGNEFINGSTSGSFDFGQVGLNGYWQLHPRLSVAAQMVSRNVGDGKENEEDLDFDYLQLKANVLSGINNSANAILGWYKIPFGIYGEHRDLPMIYNSIFLPHEHYPDYYRNRYMRARGWLFEYAYGGKLGDVKFRLFNGVSGVPSYKEVFDNFGSGSYFHAPRDKIKGAHLAYSSIDGRLKLGLSYFERDSYLCQIINDFYGNSYSGWGWYDMDIYVYNHDRASLIFGEYLYDKWTFTLEIGRLSQTYRDGVVITDFYDKSDVDLDAWRTLKDFSDGYFFQIDREINQNFAMFLRHGQRYYRDKDRDKEKSINNYIETTTAGFRWDISKNIILKGEYSYIIGGGGFIVNVGDDEDYKKRSDLYWDMVILQLVYHF